MKSVILLTLGIISGLFAQTFTEHTIAGSFNGSYFVYAADVDGDGDMDVLGAAYTDDEITWWENNGSESFTEHTIASFNGAKSVYAADVDGDGDMDVLGAAYQAYYITWWENDGSPADGGWVEHIIDSFYEGATSVYATDMDGDGDMDVMGAANRGDDITWWENNGSQTFSKHDITNTFTDPTAVYAADVDSDGDIDVLGTAGYDDEITWWENNGSESFTEHTVASFNGASSVYVADVDGDGDKDVLGAGQYADDITWWGNDGSESFTEHTIAASFDGPQSVYATDMDGDGDMDVLGAAIAADDITWWENDGSESFTEHTIAASFDGAISVYAIDVDSDGDIDVLGAANVADDITWWENDGSPSATASFISGSSFSPSVTKDQPHQAIGRFQLSSSSTFSLMAATIKLNTTRSGASDFRLWQSSDATFSSASDIQLGNMVEYDPGTGNVVSFSGFASPVSTSGTYYFLTCDVASDATGSIQGSLVNNSSLTFSGGTLSSTITNAVLSGGDVSLPVELSSFTAESSSRGVLLKWSTASELENLGFILEGRKTSSMPESVEEWEEIANYHNDDALIGQGSVTSQSDYSCTDTDVKVGLTYEYRLSDVDYSGKREYHPTISITAEEAAFVTHFSTYPNPFNPTTTIS
ncbi:MAG: VCBS repeat-containing protein, partial [Candidatus Marinimicrobia bacterium]|nr:VCBS repeat-containing protein [Candidatus Neomarinimicrobiota bacterium]